MSQLQNTRKQLQEKCDAFQGGKNLTEPIADAEKLMKQSKSCENKAAKHLKLMTSDNFDKVLSQTMLEKVVLK